LSWSFNHMKEEKQLRREYTTEKEWLKGIKK